MDFADLRDRLGYQPLLLGAFALLASATLTWVANLTREPIAAAEARDLRASLSAVLPPGLADNDLANDTLALDRGGQPLTVHLARRDGTVQAALFQTAGRGYAGEIRLLMAVDRDGRILGVRVLKHSETPGLGDKIEIAKDPWITSFEGRSLGDPPRERWGVRKDRGVFDQFSGATITPRAVVWAVRDGLDFFAAHRADILGD